MTTNYYDVPPSNGNTNPPTIVFQVNLTLLTTEAVGPNTNLVNPHVLSPFAYENNPANTVTEINNAPTFRSMWIPGKKGDKNIESWKHGTQFTAYGKHALYLKNTYGIGIAGVPADRQFLTVVSYTP